VGDTFGTCFGPLSRNRTLGVRVGQGEPIQAIIDSLTEVRRTDTHWETFDARESDGRSVWVLTLPSFTVFFPFLCVG
jgi:hypothetical protein